MSLPAEFQKGQPLTAALMNQLRREILAEISGGPGILVSRMGQSVTVSLKQQPTGLPSVLAKVTGVHHNYVAGKRMQWNATSKLWEVPAEAAIINIAKHPSLQKQFYDGKTITDAVTTTDFTFTFTNSNERQVSDGSATQDQRIVPWHETDADAPPIIIMPMGFPVLDDDGTTVVYCGYVEVGPAMWALKADA